MIPNTRPFIIFHLTVKPVVIRILATNICEDILWSKCDAIQLQCRNIYGLCWRTGVYYVQAYRAATRFHYKANLIFANEKNT